MNYAVKNICNSITSPKARVAVPGSKSITARALLLATLAEGRSTLRGVQLSEDCQTFLNAVKALGIGVEICGDCVTVEGCGGVLPVKSGKIYVGSAGTAARFLTALLALSEGEFYVDASAQMKKRPQAPLISALKGLGARFDFSEVDNCFPFVIRGTASPTPCVSVDIDKSSQYLSALLISAVCAKKPMKIGVVGSHGMDYVGMTVKMMKDFGVDVAVSASVYTVCGTYKARSYTVEPDASAACYFYAANRILGTDVTVDGIAGAVLQGDGKFIRLVENFDGGTVDMSAFSDQALTLAAIAPYFSKPTTICGVAHIRGQECDRIAAIINNLTALGIRVEEHADGVTVYPGTPRGCEIKTYGDHRVAMAFALTGLRCDGVVVKDCEVCAKTFKEYFSVLDCLIAQLTH